MRFADDGDCQRLAGWDELKVALPSGRFDTISSPLGGILKRRVALFVLASFAVVLSATSCSSPSPSSEVSAPPTSESEIPSAPVPSLKPGEFIFEPSTGGTGMMSVPGQPDAEVEKLRALVDGPGMTYLIVKMDNRQGTGNVNMYGVSIFTPEGEELKYTNVSDYIDDMRPSNAPADVYNQFIEASNKHAEIAGPKEVKDFILVGPPVPSTFTGVTVYPTGVSNPVQAVPVR